MVAPTERLARFVYEDRHLRLSNWTARDSAFKPMRHQGRLETSVFRVTGLTNDAVTDIGQFQRQDKRLLGFACLAVSEVLQCGLQVESAEPPPLHAILVGWPEGDDEDAIQQRKAIMLQLASFAGVVAKATTDPTAGT